jgi:hypothetical protein
MSYIVTLQCGCDVYVTSDLRTGLAHTRIIERRAIRCPMRSHAVGTRLPLWELLPHAAQQTPGIRLTAPRRHKVQAIP